jgi:hypothetical protein
MKGCIFYETYEVTVKNVENKIVYYKKNSGVSAPKIFARKSEKGPLPYCKTRAKSEGNN